MALTALTPKGYCSVDDVAQFLGTTFNTPAAQTFVTSMIARVEAFLENEVNREWTTGPVINEPYYAPFGLAPPSFATSYVAGWVPLGADIYTKFSPLDSVQSVGGTGWIGSDEVILVPNLDYEVRDLSIGLIRLTVPSAYYRIRLCYTPTGACPIDFALAVIMQVATWVMPMLQPDTWSLDSYTLPDLTVRYNKTFTELRILPQVSALIDNYRFRVVA